MAGLLIGTDSALYATKAGAETLTNKTLTTPTVGDMSNYTFPAGHLIQSKEINIGSSYASGNVERTNASSNPPGTHVHANFDMTCSAIPSVSSKVIKVQYNIMAAHANHAQWFIVHSWNNSSWVKSPRGAEDSAASNWGDNNSKYPHSLGGYDTDSNTVTGINVSSTWTDTTSGNNTLYVRLYWQSQNSSSHIYINRTNNNGISHGGIANSTGSIYIFQG